MTAGLAQEELARRAKIPVATVRMYERGEVQAKWLNLVKLVKALGAGLVTLGIVEGEGQEDNE